MPCKAGDRVPVPNPTDEGTVEATLFTPASASPQPCFAWVRIDEGKCKGESETVPYEQIEYT